MATKTRNGRTVDPVQQESERQTSAIAQWSESLTPFFARATALETRALETLEAARAIRAPKTEGEDEAVQRFIAIAQQDKRQVATEWEITSVVHRLHRALTSRRKVAEQAIDEALRLANSHHNRFVDEAKRRAAVEQERLRLAAQREAEEARRRELDALEDEAVRNEELLQDLSARERTFVAEVVAGIAADAAAARAGYRHPDKQSVRLLGLEKVRAAIEAEQAARLLRAQAEALKAEPVTSEAPAVKAAVANIGKHQRTTWHAELLDERKLIDAIVSGHIKAVDLLRIDTVKLNEYARGLHEQLNWPGVRAVSTTSLV